MLDTIQRHGRITLAALKEEWRRSSVNDENKELAPRTFANYKENIEEIFGIEIACDRATNEYYIVNEDNLDNNAIRDWMLNSLSLRNLVSHLHHLPILFYRYANCSRIAIDGILGIKDVIWQCISHHTSFLHQLLYQYQRVLRMDNWLSMIS